MALTATLELACAAVLDIESSDLQKTNRGIDRLINVDHEDAVLRTFILFIQTARAILKFADTHLYRKKHLSIIKLIVLIVLTSNGGLMRPSEIAEWTQTERHNITTLLDRMRREGLVGVERDSSDKRLVNVTLTDRGREVLSRAIPVAREVVHQVMLSITEGDSILLEKQLRVMRQNVHR